MNTLNTVEDELDMHLAIHDQKVSFLQTLAQLVGCKEEMGGQLPDGSRPDVLQYSSEHGILFIGDAKNTEFPGNKATQQRLSTYLEWLSTHVVSGHRRGVFAVCFGRTADTEGWLRTILRLSRQAGMEVVKVGTQQFDVDLIIAWFIFD